MTSVLGSTQWRQILDSAADTAILVTDQSGLVITCNRGTERVLGWPEHELVGQSLRNIFIDAAQLDQEIADATSTGRGGGEEGWRKRKDGSQLWAVGELSPICGDHGQIVGFVKILRDRTSQRLAELEVREDRRALEILNRAGSALASETNLNKLVQIVTDAGVDLSGAEFGAFFYNTIKESGESYMLYTLSGAPLEAFSKFPMPRNTQVFAPTFNGEGIVRSADITQDPRYGHNKPRKGMPEGHLPVRSYLAVPVISRSGEVLGGLFFGHADRGVFSDRSERGLQGLAAEAAVAIDNARLATRVQRELEVRKEAEQALKELNGTLEQQVQQRTEELRQKDAALRQSQKMESVGQLTGGVAHDFNNLLQVILGNLEIVDKLVPTESGRIRRAVSNALIGAKRAAALTQRLLAFSRRQPLDPKPLDLNALVTGMGELFYRTLGEDISTETVLSAGLWQIEADSNQLESAILNLAVNARDAMPNGGKLTIETANTRIDSIYAESHAEVVPGQYVSIAITDTGAGMAPDVMEKAFEPFYTTKAVGKGTGLGLSQVYGFVKQSHGHVKIYSEVGQGTTIKIYLPRFVGEQSCETILPEHPLPEGSNAETILVLEDDDDVRSFSTESLRDLGYNVLEAHDGPSALALLERHPCHLLFTDVVLPGGMTGAEVAEKARVLRPSLKVLFTTGYARNAIVHQGRLDRGVDLITKPFSLNDLATRVRDVLDGMKVSSS